MRSATGCREGATRAVSLGGFERTGRISLRRFGGGALVLACDVVFALAVALLLVAGQAAPAFAYVDPSVMTYAIQAFAGVAVALSAVLGVMWRRVRRKLLALLQVDENAGKEVEGAVHRVDPAHPVVEPNIVSSSKRGCGTQAACRSAAAQDATAGQEGTVAAEGASSAVQGALSESLKWKNRLAYGAIVAAFLVFTVLVVAPYELVAGASGSLVLGLSEVWLPLAVAGLAGAACLALAASLLRGRAFDIALLVMFALGLCAYVQVMTMNGALPSADGKAVDWGSFAGITVVSALVWVALVAAVLVLGHRKRLLARAGAAAVSVFLIVVQAVGVAGLFVAPPAQGEDALGAAAGGEPIRVTQEGLFEVSEKGNVVVFVLDMFDTRQMQHLLDGNPAAFDELSDFTLFTNVSGSMIPTRYAVPYLLTGQFPREDELFSQYLSERYARSSFLDGINEAGYSVGLYSDTLGFEYLPSDEVQRVADLTENLHEVASPRIDNVGTVLTLWKCALYRDSPWLLKRFFWFYTDEVNNNMVEQNVAVGAAGDDAAEGSGDGATGDGAAETPYTIDDARYYRSLCDRGLEVREGGSGAFRFIHLLGAHYPYSMDENAQDVGVDNSTLDAQSLGALHIVEEYVRQLKDAGVYDNTTVIVTADHGEWYCTMQLDEPTSPLLMVKPAANDGALGQEGGALGQGEGALGREAEAGDSDEEPDGTSGAAAVSAASAPSGAAASEAATGEGNTTDAPSSPRVCDAAVSHADFQATVLDALGLRDEDPKAFPGYSLLDVARGLPGAQDAFANRVRYYYVTTSDGKHDQQIQQYEIAGNALDFSTWNPTGIEWNAQE